MGHWRQKFFNARILSFAESLSAGSRRSDFPRENFELICLPHSLIFLIDFMCYIWIKAKKDIA
ncbi:hypothetical protein H6H03_02845 [Nostoc paludosum FACHB-159]|uniref:Uncharacterized protein n=1 Tax=Nostoc paludosum FACHB-159 TaxID=2692908 RepID=A0ABR8K078_9NOSO|nr:hypothetical protein [Nostoc paludosum FACHB-159]